MSSYSSSGGVPSGALVTRKVDNFAGVDFSNSDTNLSRSPDSLNMWKNYKNNSAGIETRPDMELVEEYNNTIFVFNPDNYWQGIITQFERFKNEGTAKNTSDNSLVFCDDLDDLKNNLILIK